MKFVSTTFFLLFICGLSADSKSDLKEHYDMHAALPITVSDIGEHLPTLRMIAQECSTVTEMGMRYMESTWGLLQGLADNQSNFKSYVGIDIAMPPAEVFTIAKKLAEENGISFTYFKGNTTAIDIDPTEMLFIDTWHNYCQLTYELDKFSSKVKKYIVMHDTGAPYGTENEPNYYGFNFEYPSYIDRNKKGLWQAVVDFLERNPEWRLHNRYHNCHGLTILKRNN